MIKDWSKFNENNHVWFDTKDRLKSENKPTIIKVIDDVRDCFTSFEDLGIINRYNFGGMYNPNKERDAKEHFKMYPSPSFSNRTIHGEPSELDIERISEFFVPEYQGEFVNRFMGVGINFPYEEDGGWIGSKGIDLLDDLIEDKNRLKSIGYDMEICFWRTKFNTNNHSHLDPLEVRVYFDLDCEWPELSEEDLN